MTISVDTCPDNTTSGQHRGPGAADLTSHTAVYSLKRNWHLGSGLFCSNKICGFLSNLTFHTGYFENDRRTPMLLKEEEKLKTRSSLRTLIRRKYAQIFMGKCDIVTPLSQNITCDEDGEGHRKWERKCQHCHVSVTARGGFFYFKKCHLDNLPENVCFPTQGEKLVLINI